MNHVENISKIILYIFFSFHFYLARKKNKKQEGKFSIAIKKKFHVAKKINQQPSSKRLPAYDIKEINFIVRILSNAIGYDKNVLLHDRRFTIGNANNESPRDVRAHCSDTKAYEISDH